MIDITLQPLGVLIGLAITGVFAGIGGAIGSTITKLWLEPLLHKWKKHTDRKKIKETMRKVFK